MQVWSREGRMTLVDAVMNADDDGAERVIFVYFECMNGDHFVSKKNLAFCIKVKEEEIDCPPHSSITNPLTK
jgi:hypothetical protein